MTKEEAIEAKRVAEVVIAKYEELDAAISARKILNSLSADRLDVTVECGGYKMSIPLQTPHGLTVWKTMLTLQDELIDKLKNKINGL